MASDDPATVAATAARGFQVGHCQACAENIRNTLVAAGLPGELVELRTAGGRDFMVCVSFDGGQATITQNGRHVGVRVGNMAFDNLHPDGMHFDRWLKDFDAVGGVIVSSPPLFRNAECLAWLLC